MNREQLLFPNEPARFDREEFHRLLRHAKAMEASDIHIKTMTQVMCRVHGKMVPVTRRRLEQAELGTILEVIYGAANAELEVRTGKPLDNAYRLTIDRETALRFRWNARACEVQGGFGMKITLRELPGMPPPLPKEELGQQVVEALFPDEGLVLICGATGSGKSTLLAGIVQEKATQADADCNIVSLESPIEFTYDKVKTESCMITQGAVPQHLPSFAQGVVNSLREDPDIIIVGEARDAATIEAAVLASQTGHAVYTTVHSNTVGTTFLRLTQSLPIEKAGSILGSLIDAIRVIICQRLYPSTDGRRVAVRETLVFDRDIRRELLLAATSNLAELPAVADALVRRRGQTLLAHAETLVAAGRLDPMYAEVLRADEQVARQRRGGEPDMRLPTSQASSALAVAGSQKEVQGAMAVLDNLIRAEQVESPPEAAVPSSEGGPVELVAPSDGVATGSAAYAVEASHEIPVPATPAVVGLDEYPSHAKLGVLVEIGSALPPVDESVVDPKGDAFLCDLVAPQAQIQAQDDAHESEGLFETPDSPTYEAGDFSFLDLVEKEQVAGGRPHDSAGLVGGVEGGAVWEAARDRVKTHLVDIPLPVAPPALGCAFDLPDAKFDGRVTEATFAAMLEDILEQESVQQPPAFTGQGMQGRLMPVMAAPVLADGFDDDDDIPPVPVLASAYPVANHATEVLPQRTLATDVLRGTVTVSEPVDDEVAAALARKPAGQPARQPAVITAVAMVDGERPLLTEARQLLAAVCDALSERLDDEASEWGQVDLARDFLHLIAGRNQVLDPTTLAGRLRQHLLITSEVLVRRLAGEAVFRQSRPVGAANTRTTGGGWQLVGRARTVAQELRHGPA